MSSDKPFSVEIDSGKKDAKFWVMHPIGRAIASGVLTTISSTTTPTAGVVYGLISGVINAVSYSLFKEVSDNVYSPSMKGVNYWASCVMPWLGAAAIMKKYHEMTNKAHFKLTPATAIGVGMTISIFGYSNKNLIDGGYNHYKFKYVMNREKED